MACKLLTREEVPEPPRRVLNGVVDEGLDRWRYRDGLLVTYIHYLEEADRRPDQLPWAKLWDGEDGRR